MISYHLSRNPTFTTFRRILLIAFIFLTLGFGVVQSVRVTGRSVAEGGPLIEAFAPDERPNLESARMISSASTFGGQFGTSTAVDGDTIIVGAPFDRSVDQTQIGGAYVYVRNGANWVAQASLVIPEGGSQFGYSVAISGDTVVIGAPFHSFDGITAPGSAFVFVRSDGIWNLQQRLNASNSSNGAQFGYSVSIDGDTVVVGARYDSSVSQGSGSAYVFIRSGATWTQEAKLTDLDGNLPFQYLYGSSVDIHQDTAIVGVPFGGIGSVNFKPGFAVVYRRSGGVWLQEGQLVASDGLDADRVGQSVAIDGDTAIVGADMSQVTPGVHAGASYLFSRSGSTWTQIQKLTSPDTGGTGGFGTSVGISGNKLIIGEPRADVRGNSRQGAGWEFVASGGTWVFQNRLVGSDGLASDRFGTAVAISGNRLVCGSPFYDVMPARNEGAAYLFVESPRTPDLQAASDDGISDTDNVTTQSTLTFNVDGITPGAEVELLRDNIVVDSKVADQDSAHLTDPLAPLDGSFQYTSRQIVAGEIGSQSDYLTVTVDNAAPVVTINQAPGTADPSAGPTYGFQVSFNEPVLGFDASHISLAGSTANVSNATISVSNNPIPNLVTIGNVVSDGQYLQVSVLPGAVTDLVGHVSSQSVSTDNSVTVDNVGPTLTVNQAVSQLDPTSTLPIIFTVTSSEPVTIFAVSFSGSTANMQSAHATVTGSGNAYTVTVSGVLSNGQFVRVSIPDRGARDALGNLNPSAATIIDNTVTLDNEGPRVTVNQAVGQDDPTARLPINFSVQFTEPVNGFTASSLSYAGSTVNTTNANAIITGSGATYNVAVAGIAPAGVLRVSINAGAVHDEVGNGSYASTSSDNSVTLDYVGDGRFEFTTNTGQNPYWSSTSTQFGTSLCTLSSCGNGGGTATPRSGNGWVWFDGTGQTAAEHGTVSQVVTFPFSGVATLNYYSRIGVVNAPFNSTVQVKIDGTTVQTLFEPSTAESGYTQRTVDVSAYADGMTHNVSFEYNRPAGGLSDNFSLDDVSLNFQPPIISQNVVLDFDGDGKTDLSIFRPNGATGSEWWYLKSSNGGNFATQFGTPTDKLVAADYTGDGKADIAFFRPSTGQWFILRSEDSSFYAFPFGAAGDVPAPADYDGDGKADAAVFRTSNSTWFIQNSGGGTTIQAFGATGDVPVVGDYDGDGKADLAIFRPNGTTGSEWWILRSTAGLIATQFGAPTDKTEVGDYTGDGKADVAFWRPSTGEWYILRSEDSSFYAFPFGSNGDIPVPGDYDGDGKTDAGVFRPSNSTWFVNRSTGGTIIQQFGSAGDIPVPNEFVR